MFRAIQPEDGGEILPVDLEEFLNLNGIVHPDPPGPYTLATRQAHTH